MNIENTKKINEKIEYYKKYGVLEQPEKLKIEIVNEKKELEKLTNLQEKCKADELKCQNVQNTIELKINLLKILEEAFLNHVKNLVQEFVPEVLKKYEEENKKYNTILKNKDDVIKVLKKLKTENYNEKINIINEIFE